MLRRDRSAQRFPASSKSDHFCSQLGHWWSKLTSTSTGPIENDNKKGTLFRHQQATRPADPETRPTTDPDQLEAASDQAIAACGGDARDALIVANEFLEAQVEKLQTNVTKGYAGGYHH